MEPPLRMKSGNMLSQELPYAAWRTLLMLGLAWTYQYHISEIRRWGTVAPPSPRRRTYRSSAWSVLVGTQKSPTSRWAGEKGCAWRHT